MYYNIKIKNIFEESNLRSMLNRCNIAHSIIFILALMLLIYISGANYVLFHVIVENLSTVVCLSLVLIIINTHKMSNNNYFIYLGIGYSFISLFNFLHGIAYTGILNILKNPINLSSQLNICYRLMEGFSFIVSFIFLCKDVKHSVVFHCYAFISSLLLYLIFFTSYFPTCFIYNLGLTKFAISCEYIILLLMLTAILTFIKNIKYFSKSIVFYMGSYLILTILLRCISIADSNTFNDFSVMSHILKLISYFFLYKALVENVLQNPLKILYNDLSNKNKELNEKTSELEKTVAKLNEYNINLEKTKEELEISKNTYKKLVEFLPDAIFVSRNSKFTYVNTAAIKLLKAKNEKDLLGKCPFDFTHEDYLHIVRTELENKKDDINSQYNLTEYKLITLDGEIIDVELKSTPIGLKEEDTEITVIYDIRERKKAEKTAKLLNEAQENERLKTEFFANLSHELRTPINVIYSALQVIEINNGQNFAKKYNGIIKQNCYRLLRLINNIIDSTKIDAGFLKLNLTYKNIVPVVEDITLSISSYVESKGMNLIFDTDVEELYLDFDPDVIERILLNLLSNAVKFTRENGTITVNIYHNNKNIILCVKDDGIGIPKDQQLFIFDRFKQVDKSFSRNKEGSGIGLSLVKSLVELHKGTITLNSMEGAGSEFIIQLPIFQTLKYSNQTKQTIDSNIVQKINIEFSDIYS
ncbi:MASE3 domain-containing sensor histidine kinase [Clostridium lundense]|uniref:sensor histidine kinase n=1 Tax=Clostridium lundense TaxID=319475 RepID=UPI0004898976|nr:MASE3 domain-containing protein [Clostridium lundense]